MEVKVPIAVMIGSIKQKETTTKQSEDLRPIEANLKSNVRQEAQTSRHKAKIPVKPYYCTMCEKTFDRKSYVDRHMKSHKEQNLLDAEERFSECDKLLLEYMRVHTVEKPFKCDLCEASFTQNSDLRRHKRIHTGEKPFQCDLCGARYRESHHLKFHKKVHSGEKPFKCELCALAFIEKGGLKRHMRSHSGERPFECHLCEASYKQKGELKRHHKRCHAG